MPLLDDLRTTAIDVAARSYVPYSQKPSGAAVLLSDGLLVRGARVESASYSLVIPSVQNAITTAVALGRADIVAVAVSEDEMSELDAIYVAAFLPDAIPGARSRSSPALSVSSIADEINPKLPIQGADADGGVRLARAAAERAHVPLSRFPVGAVALYDDGFFVPGVNVEHPDWSLVLCAERNMLGTIVTYGLPVPDRIFVSCVLDASASPCGACRQLLAEQTPRVPVSIDRGAGPVEVLTPEALLPGSFTGSTLIDPQRDPNHA